MRSSLYCLSAFKVAFVAARVLPRRIAHWLAQRIGLWAYGKRPESQRALRENLAVVSGLAGGALEALCAGNVANFSRMLADYFYCSAGGSASCLLERWDGMEAIERGRGEGRGVILVTAHCGNWELGGVLLALHGLPMSVVTLEEPSTELTRWRDAYRQKVGIRTHPVGPGHSFSFIEMIAALRGNGVMAMLVDRPHEGTGTAVEFFGRRTEFSTGPALLWQHTRAAVIPAFVLRNASGQYTAIAHEPLNFVKSDDPRADVITNTQILATHFENVIRQHPDQWFNYVPIWPIPEPAAAAETDGHSAITSAA